MRLYDGRKGLYEKRNNMDDKLCHELNKLIEIGSDKRIMRTYSC